MGDSWGDIASTQTRLALSSDPNITDVTDGSSNVQRCNKCNRCNMNNGSNRYHILDYCNLSNMICDICVKDITYISNYLLK